MQVNMDNNITVYTVDMATEWQSKTDDRLDKTPKEITRLLINREHGAFARKGKQFHFLRCTYFSFFPIYNTQIHSD